ncbi:RNA methyltransferase [Odoribacter sp. OttesenSCG-928-J03]|nr:RNA methyltransferase [Odoribacter sp. OttesenSCG-928-J03]MDL2283368.1 RNA methyltransferase [Odoribacter sp. OttesenSCG-928-G04]
MATKREQLECLKNFVTEEKNLLFDRLIIDRTDYITIVLEDLFQSHNQSAVMRTADCMGVQNLHIIENRNSYDTQSTVSRGARKWLSLHRYRELQDNTPTAIQKLKESGYRIIATSPHANDVSIEDLDIEKGKMAFFFGTELTGLSPTVMEEADEFVKIPMYGFTESLNVSVCAALIMHTTMSRLRKSDVNWRLSEEEKVEVLLEWYKRTVKASEKILQQLEK